ncbi:formate hydrogenlyase maturation protein HycH [Consotaella salsifontis]|uniref:Hydrogenase-4 component J n=1 Tax=Consotaella salsifontis TaxID=1365950 RepID=A0A1T4RNA3_9HYPH|nr:formate hydrogenlyase maturation protein HycH [Consotaella salsifontis]SKA17464.1 hydrogenase-4 component J [Consotaella salsifontis]
MNIPVYTATEEVIFYQLKQKFLERKEDIPEKSKEVMYYSLAIGHHIGVFDCFKPQFRAPRAAVDRIIEALPEDSEARRKLAGLYKFGEIIVDITHVGLLKTAVAEVSPKADAEMAAFLAGLDTCLDAIRDEPAIYLMGRWVR